MITSTIGSAPGQPTRSAAIRTKPPSRDLARALAAEMGVSWNEIVDKGRDRNLVRVRQTIQWIVSRESRLSLPQLGRLFARDHSTIIHSRHAVGLTTTAISP